MDPTRDFAEVVKLIEIGFQEELDPAGWKMLHQMRQMASRGLWAQILHGSMIRLQGFVWTERSRVVGTLSLRRSSPGWRAGWLIGNVVVHPDYRGQGIG
ncbi:MAG: GNAT family N-acetyltransferase, partial [Anaerolineae bacterium]